MFSFGKIQCLLLDKWEIFLGWNFLTTFSITVLATLK
jgi:hypothetical protein